MVNHMFFFPGYVPESYDGYSWRKSLVNVIVNELVSHDQLAYKLVNELIDARFIKLSTCN